MNIELHIERLILDGLAVEPNSHTELQSAVEAELTRLLAASGLSPEWLSGGAMRSLKAGEIQVTNQMDAAHLGNQIAQALHGGIGAGGIRQRQGNSSDAISRSPLGSR